MSIRNLHALQMVYGTRDQYRGVFRPLVATPVQPAKLIALRPSYECVLATIQDHNGESYWRVRGLDDARLSLLSAQDRGTVQSAVARVLEVTNG